MEAGPRMQKHDGRKQRQLLFATCDFREKWFGLLLADGRDSDQIKEKVAKEGGGCLKINKKERKVQSSRR